MKNLLIYKKINSKQKNNIQNNLFFSEKFLSTTLREINNKKNNNDKR